MHKLGKKMSRMLVDAISRLVKNVQDNYVKNSTNRFAQNVYIVHSMRCYFCINLFNF